MNPIFLSAAIEDLWQTGSGCYPSFAKHPSGQGRIRIDANRVENHSSQVSGLLMNFQNPLQGVMGLGFMGRKLAGQIDKKVAHGEYAGGNRQAGSPEKIRFGQTFAEQFQTVPGKGVTGKINGG